MRNQQALCESLSGSDLLIAVALQCISALVPLHQTCLLEETNSISGSNAGANPLWMARLTISLSERDHYALKLLALRDRKRLTLLVTEAIKLYLRHSGAYDLDIRETDSSAQQPGKTDD